jgi:hypothetical protein
MAFVEDNDPFLADFAVSATKNGSVAVSGVFDKAYGEAYGMIAGNDPVFRCPTASAVVRGNTLLIGGVTYTVTNVEGDGTGWDVCRLEAA